MSSIGYKRTYYFLYRFYNHKLKFVERVDKNALFKNRIYSILNHKFE